MGWGGATSLRGTDRKYIRNLFGNFSFIYGMSKKHETSMMSYHPGIRIDRIPVNGIPGIMFVAATIFMFLGTVPAAREFFVITGITGILGAGFLYCWRNQTRW